MNTIKNRLTKLKNKDPDAIGKTIVHMMETFGWTFDEVKKITMPQFLELTRLMSVINKDKDKKQKQWQAQHKNKG